MIRRKLGNAIAQKHIANRAELYRNLIKHEAKIGGQLFGPVSGVKQREFFCLDDRTWIWHEEWTDGRGYRRTITTRYDIQPTGVYKAQDRQPYMLLNKSEMIRLQKATKVYKNRVFSEMYGQIVETP